MTEATRSLTKDTTNHIATITLNGCDEANLMTSAMARELCAHLDAVDIDDDVKVVIIRPEGDHLCGGWDPADTWSHYLEAPGGSLRKHPSQRARLLAQDQSWWGPRGLYGRLLHCRKVTIVEARGMCLDAGLYLALCSDLVITSEDGCFGSPRWHNIGVDGDMSLLFGTVGLKRAKELMYCNVAWSAHKALEYGLVDYVADDPSRAVYDLATACCSIMRDGIVTEKYAVFASLEKMGVGHSFAATTVVAASLSNIHFQPGEYNFLRDLRNSGPATALSNSRADFRVV